jgi:hypothetical protein
MDWSGKTPTADQGFDRARREGVEAFVSASLVTPPRPVVLVDCEDCAGSGIVYTHVCRDARECRLLCPVQQVCFGCLGLKKVPIK